MANVKLSANEYKQLLDEVCKQGDYRYGTPQTFPTISTLFGYPFYRKEDDYFLIVACEYCGTSSGFDKYDCCARCGAPLSGTHLTKRTPDVAIVAQIIEVLLKNRSGERAGVA